MGDGRIPWTAVHSYCQANDYEPDLEDDCHFYLRHLDDAWLGFQKNKRDQENAARMSPPKK